MIQILAFRFSRYIFRLTLTARCSKVRASCCRVAFNIGNTCFTLQIVYLVLPLHRDLHVLFHQAHNLLLSSLPGLHCAGSRSDDLLYQTSNRTCAIPLIRHKDIRHIKSTVMAGKSNMAPKIISNYVLEYIHGVY